MSKSSKRKMRNNTKVSIVTSYLQSFAILSTLLICQSTFRKDINQETHAFVVVTPTLRQRDISRSTIPVQLTSSAATSTSDDSSNVNQGGGFLQSIFKTRVEDKTSKDVQKYRRRRRKIITRKAQAVTGKTLKRRISLSSSSKDKPKRTITTLSDLDDHWNDTRKLYRKSVETNEIDYNALLRAADVVGNTQIIGSSSHLDYVHPVSKLMHERVANKYDNQHNKDNFKIALAVEGGGMRGCVSAGMVCAIHYLNLTHTIDEIYGSSAGTIVSAYLITGQLPWFGPELYYDSLTTAGRQFIDTRRLLRAVGLGLLDPRLYKDVITRPGNGKPVLNLNYLLKQTVEGGKKLDWEKFKQRQQSLPLNVVVSGLREERSYALNLNRNGAFQTFSELTDAMHASCLLPGIAGPVANIRKDRLVDDPKNYANSSSNSTSNDNNIQTFVFENDLNIPSYEPLADALLFEPIPYRSAIKDGATHVLVIRSRPDGVDVTGKGGTVEDMIFRRFFMKKNKLPNMYKRLQMQLHKKIYAEDIIKLNDAAAAATTTDRSHIDDATTTTSTNPQLMTMAIPPGSEEVSRLEIGREAIFYGLRRGFARAYDCLVQDPNDRGRGMEMAELFFPDEILQYDPTSFERSDDKSAFELYMERNNIIPKIWQEYGDENPMLQYNVPQDQ